MKWLWIILLIVVGIVAAVFAYRVPVDGDRTSPELGPGHVAVKSPVNGKQAGTT